MTHVCFLVFVECQCQSECLKILFAFQGVNDKINRMKHFHRHKIPPLLLLLLVEEELVSIRHNLIIIVFCCWTTDMKRKISSYYVDMQENVKYLTTNLNIGSRSIVENFQSTLDAIKSSEVFQ